MDDQRPSAELCERYACGGLAVVEAAVVLEVRWRGAALDRLLDEGHAILIAAVADQLRRLGWLVEVEVTYSEYGERGSYDIMAFMPMLGILLVIEVKTELASAELTLRKLDEKTRLARKIAFDRFSWRATSVSRLLVLPEITTERRRVARHSAIFEGALPSRNHEIRRWLEKPADTVAGIWFFAARDAGVAISEIRRARSGSDGRNRTQITFPPLLDRIYAWVLAQRQGSAPAGRT